MIVCGMLLASASLAHASATLFLEEPYGKLGFFTATGHAAVYLSGVCADSPTVLRLCAPGESGVVLSRYDGVDGYDWLAIPLVPYLYAVDRPEEVPLFADAKLVSYLRNRYRRQHLEAIAPDTANGEPPAGNWYELVGSSYDRTIYGFEIETTRGQDAALIEKLNSSPNRSHFRTVSHNCADFAKDIINFYHPKALHRSVVADVGITTPKQMAKTLTKFGSRHPDLEFSRTVISQVPGSLARSTPVHGVVESFFKSKKYIVPSAVVSPIFAGCVFAVYVGTGAGRFDPARDAMVFQPGSDPQAPLSARDRKTYRRQLKNLLAEVNAPDDQNVDKTWEKLQSKGWADFDENEEPILKMQYSEHVVRVGLSAANVLEINTPPQLTQAMLEARLQSELHRSSRVVSEGDIARDWNLLQFVLREGNSHLRASVAPSVTSVIENRP
jgi:hypothetical protein